jgi:hypothetical protein
MKGRGMRDRVRGERGRKHEEMKKKGKGPTRKVIHKANLQPVLDLL